MAKSGPNCFLVGASKSGTTYLAEVLGRQPGVYVPAKKEFHFYADDLNCGGLRVASHERYLQYFEPGNESIWRIDASTSYLYSDSAAQKIKAVYPEARIIIMLRNPVVRAYSMYWHNRLRGYETLEFWRALQEEAMRVSEHWLWSFHYLHSGLYAAQVKRYLELFPRENIHILFSEHLFNDHEKYMRRILRWLSLQYSNSPPGEARNASGAPRNLWISRLLSPSNEMLRRVGNASPDWLLKLRRRLIAWNTKRPPPMSHDVAEFLCEYFRKDVYSLTRELDMDVPWQEFNQEE